MKLKASNGVQLTQGLFYEHNNPDAPFTLRTEDYTARNGKKYTSMYKIYMECADEYEAAMKLLGSLQHWRKLVDNCKWFREGHYIGEIQLPGLNQWREDMRLRDLSTQKKALMQEAETGNVAAMRYLHEQANKTKGAGRPATKKQKAPASVSNIQDRFNKIKES